MLTFAAFLLTAASILFGLSACASLSTGDRLGAAMGTGGAILLSMLAIYTWCL